MPSFQLRCLFCAVSEDRICTNDEKHRQYCLMCGKRMKYQFIPTRSKAVVFANDSKEYPLFTGPKQKSRMIKERGLIEYGSESLDTVRKEHERFASEKEAREEKEANTTVMEALGELGDSGMYHTIPTHVHKRQEREAHDKAQGDPENTGAGLVGD